MITGADLIMLAIDNDHVLAALAALTLPLLPDFNFNFEYFIAVYRTPQKVRTKCITAYQGVFTTKYQNTSIDISIHKINT